MFGHLVELKCLTTIITRKLSRAICTLIDDFFNFRLITNRDEWYFNDDACTKVGDAFGRIPQTRWVPHVREFTKNGGPVHWIHENYACPNCMWDTVDNNVHLDC